VLRAMQPSVYDRLWSAQSAAGVTLADCIGYGKGEDVYDAISNRIGFLAGDGDCYQAFHQAIDPVIRGVQRGWVTEAHSQTEKDHLKDISDHFAQKKSDHLDPNERRVVEVQACIRRNIEGLKMPPAASVEDDAVAEKLLLSVLEGLVEPLCVHRPSAGKSDCVSGGATFEAWINEEDHLRLRMRQPGANLREACQHLSTADAALRDAVGKAGHAFLANSRLGYITASPANLGTGFQAQATLRLPFLAASRAFGSLCRRLHLQVRPSRDKQRLGAGEGQDGETCDLWDISNIETLGTTESYQTNTVIIGINKLLEVEKKFAEGDLAGIARLVLAEGAAREPSAHS